jgi:hypothetical protein
MAQQSIRIRLGRPTLQQGVEWDVSGQGLLARTQKDGWRECRLCIEEAMTILVLRSMPRHTPSASMGVCLGPWF